MSSGTPHFKTTLMDRTHHPVLVPSAHSLGGIAAIRSLGRAGYPVHAAAQSRAALGLRSRFATRSIVHPPVGDPDFAEWFTRYVTEEGIELVIPGAGISPTMSPSMGPFSSLFPISSDPSVLLRQSKFALFEHLLDADEPTSLHLPPTLLLDSGAPPPTGTALQRLGTPLFIKVDGEHAFEGQGEDAVVRVETVSEAQNQLTRMRKVYRKTIVQGFVRGVGVGVFLLRWNGRLIAQQMHQRIHEVPHTGGASSLRKTWWHPGIAADAARKLDHVGWQGAAMVEYRFDRHTGDFNLMEMNLRLWGSLHLSLYAGVDFPLLWADAFFGELPPKTLTGKIGTVSRHLIPGEISHLTSLWRDPEVTFRHKIRSAGRFLALSFNPRIKSDLLFPGDRALFLAGALQFLRRSIRRNPKKTSGAPHK